MLSAELQLTLAAFGVVSSLTVLFAIFVRSRQGAVVERFTVSGGSAGNRPAEKRTAAPSPLPRMGQMMMPKDENQRGRLKSRLRQAGLYQRHSTAVYLGIKLLFMVVPTIVGVGLSSIGLITLTKGVLMGAVVGLLGNVIPSFWLGQLKAGRQKNIRRALPDALDVIVICLEGGLSLPGAFDRVSSELSNAHPLLASEMAIVRREIQLGRSTGEALRQFADRFDAEELRSMASVIIQAERYGASVVKALRVHADSLRVKRYQQAETQAQKAPIKLIFPTVLCIFPALYVILMGPAGVQLLKMLEDLE